MSACRCAVVQPRPRASRASPLASNRRCDVTTTRLMASMRRLDWRRGWLLLALLALAPTQALAWWQTDWSYRKQITVDTTPKGANITQAVGRMPVLIRLHTGNFSFTDAQENGNDIRFVNSDDKTPLPFHVESFDPLLGVA